MKADLDRLMTERDLTAVIVAGGEGANPARYYLTNGADITSGLIVKPRGADPTLLANPMEIEEARKGGIAALTLNDLDWHELVEAAEGDRTRAEIALWGRVLTRLNVLPGRVGVYGTGPLEVYIELIRLMDEAHGDYQFVGELGKSLFAEAMQTKDAGEVARMQSVAERTSRVLEQTWDFIAGHTVAGETVVNADGAALTIGTVKRFVRRALLDVDLEDTGMIFAQGRDAGFPHSRGEADDALRLGQSIVFDLFPREIGGGYYHDTTRTWCLGHAPENVQRAYDQVMTAFDIAVETCRVGEAAKAPQIAVLDYFESQGHATSRSQPGTMHGYVHSLGHGVGLDIHERPALSHLSQDTLTAGMVMSIEPGLYYPDDGYGVRVEDLCYLADDGQLVTLTNFRKDLVLPVGGTT